MELNRARFYSVVYGSTFDVHDRFNIGTYKEKQLHIILKKYFEPDPAFHEVPTEGFIADIRRGDEITEIETSGFTGLKPKLEAYFPAFRVELVHPLAGVKYVSWIDPETRAITPRKRSPKKEGAYDLLFEMVRILPFVAEKNLTVLGPVLEVDEYRLLDGWSRDRKRGSHRYERMPVELIDMIELKTDDDYRRWIPADLAETFTVRDFAEAARIPEGTARAVMKVMEARGVLSAGGKKGNARLYARARKGTAGI